MTEQDQIDALAAKLVDVVAALVAADGQIEQRLAALEAVVGTIGDPRLGPSDTYRAGRSLLARLNRRTGTDQGAGPEGAV